MSATSMSKQIIDTNAFCRARKLMNCLDRQSLTHGHWYSQGGHVTRLQVAWVSFRDLIASVLSMLSITSTASPD